MAAGFALVAAKSTGLYDRDRVLWHTTVDELSSLISWAAMLVVALVISLQATAQAVPSAGDLLGSLTAVVAIGAVLRVMARTVWRQSTPPERIVVIGTGAVLRAVERKFEIFHDFHGVLVGT